jgi:hypothetical protein
MAASAMHIRRKKKLTAGGLSPMSDRDRWWMQARRLHRRVVSLGDVNAGGGKGAYHHEQGGEYEER